MLTHNNILFSERVFVEGLERTSDDVMWMPAPLNHAVGFFHGLIAPMLLGGRSVLMQDFAVKDAVDLINAEGATWSMCSTPFIYDIVKYLDAHPDESLPTYVLHSCGGAPVPGALIDRAHNHDILLCEIFGSTSSSSQVSNCWLTSIGSFMVTSTKGMAQDNIPCLFPDGVLVGLLSGPVEKKAFPD